MNSWKHLMKTLSLNVVCMKKFHHDLKIIAKIFNYSNIKMSFFHVCMLNKILISNGVKLINSIFTRRMSMNFSVAMMRIFIVFCSYFIHTWEAFNMRRNHFSSFLVSFPRGAMLYRCHDKEIVSKFISFQLICLDVYGRWKLFPKVFFFNHKSFQMEKSFWFHFCCLPELEIVLTFVR